MNRCQHFNNLIKKMGNMAGGGNLPVEYKQVQYIRATGTQYINTGVKTANGIGIRAKISSDSGEGNPEVCGARTSNTNRYFFWIFDPRMTIWYGYKTTYGDTGKAWVPGAVYDIESYIGTSQITLEQKGTGGWTYSTGTGGLYSGNLDLYIFATNDYGTGVSNLLSGNLYSFSMYDNNGNIRDMYPCYRKSDNKPGMYDKITKQFFTNSGTGEFILGPET